MSVFGTLLMGEEGAAAAAVAGGTVNPPKQPDPFGNAPVNLLPRKPVTDQGQPTPTGTSAQQPAKPEKKADAAPVAAAAQKPETKPTDPAAAPTADAPKAPAAPPPPAEAKPLESTTIPYTRPEFNAAVKGYAAQLDLASLEKKYGLPKDILAAVMQVESCGNKDADSGKAHGLFQFTPPTAKAYGVNVNDPQSSAEGAAHLLSDLLKKFDGNIGLALAGYNCNPAKIEKNKDKYEKWPKETRAYVPKVMKYAGLPVPSNYNFSDDAIKFGGTQSQGNDFDIGEWAGDFFGNGAVGNIIGMVLGVVGAWMLGNTFGGGGMWGTLLTLVLAIPMAILGSNSIGGWVNGMMGVKKNNDVDDPAQQVAKGQSPGLSATRGLGVESQKLTVAQALGNEPRLVKHLTEAELVSLISDSKDPQQRLIFKADGVNVTLAGVSNPAAPLAQDESLLDIKKIAEQASKAGIRDFGLDILKDNQGYLVNCVPEDSGRYAAPRPPMSRR